MGNTVQEWLFSLKGITFIWFWTALLIPLLIRYEFINPWNLILQYDLILTEYQLWRILTAVFASAINFKWFLKLYYLGTYSRALEDETFKNRRADYFFLLICNWILCVIGGIWIIPLPTLMSAMVNSVVCSWCLLHSEETVRLWFSIDVSALKYPIILFITDLLIDYDWRGQLVGVVAAYIFYYVTEGWAKTKTERQPLIKTPEILKKFFPSNDSHSPLFTPNHQFRGNGRKLY